MTEQHAPQANSDTHGSEKPRVHVGLIGNGIQLSRTPKMHLEEGKAFGFDYHYDLIDTALHPQPIQDALEQVEAAGFRGVNVTHPFKQEVLKYLDDISDAARAVNAANTVVFQEGRRIGHNTDYWGFAEAFRTRMAEAPKGRVLLIGAGGAGGAVANALLDNGVEELLICDKAPELAQKLADPLTERLGPGRVMVVDDAAVALPSAQGVVNATPVGMASYPGTPVPTDLLDPAQWVADIIYFPLETQFLREARARGCASMDGSGMALFQAVRAFELFTGVKPDAERMRATFDAFTQ